MSKHKFFSVPDFIKVSFANDRADANKNHLLSPLQVTRRWVLAASGVAVFLHGSRRLASAHASERTAKGISQPVVQDDRGFIARAFEMRRLAINKGDQPYGAVIVQGGVIIGQSWSRVVLDNDPTGHAEISAIRDAAHRVNNHDLSGTVMYSSSRPCPMCEAAAYWAGINQMIHGRKVVNAGPHQLCR